MTDHTVVSREEWQAARDELLRREKEHTRMAEALARQRRELPWTEIGKEYRFDTDEGMRTLAELFAGRSQLMLCHFMFGPAYEAGCPVNSSMADGFDGLLPHLHARDVTFLLVSQAPLAKLQAYKRRMGWAPGTDGYLTESPAVTVFTLASGSVYQTYAASARGVEFLMGYYPILDRVPKGRDEEQGFQTWIRRHDEYA